MMHYHAEGDVNSVIEPHGFLLVDNGGQYDCGTTDITRTYPVGPLTDNERRYYTWVLQSHIDMARAVFLDYCTGFALDTFCPAARSGRTRSTTAAAPATASASSPACMRGPRARRTTPSSSTPGMTMHR